MWEDKEVIDVLKIIAPGTSFREGLENVLKARTGGLIVVGDSKEVLSVVDGGFEVNQDYSPALLYELAKMDGAIVVSKDLKRILYANAQLTPERNIPTTETGTRHRTAERVAKQTGELVISISQRRNVITLFKGSQRYVLPDTGVVLTRANQALQTLEKYKSSLDGVMNNLNALEFEDMVTLENVCSAIQRIEMVLKIATEVERYIYELGDESRLVEMQLNELIGDTKFDLELIVRDYIKGDEKDVENAKLGIKDLTYTELNDTNYLSKILGYSGVTQSDMLIKARGYRVLSMIPRMPSFIIDKLVSQFGDLQGIMNASITELDDVDGIGEIRAKNISDGLKRMREQTLFDIRF
ncbi:MAG: DNA integrity scanning diadenylate cyclase DisA [Clostridia bacterium]|nr:DNA integrity scanning diadenylate cyclase DisA [Clostridia bacterium]